MKFLSHRFDNNRKWAAEIKRRDPEYFERLSQIQRPEYLWIGCAGQSDQALISSSERWKRCFFPRTAAAHFAQFCQVLTDDAEKYSRRLTATSETNMTPV